MLRHVKILEAIGMFLVLIAWYLNWQSVETFADAERKFTGYFQGLLEVQRDFYIDANVRLEAAIMSSRALPGLSSANATPTTGLMGYERGWHSDEVRVRWLERAMVTLVTVEEYANFLQITDQYLSLQLNDSIKGLTTSLSSIRKDLKDRVAPAELAIGRVPTPAPDAITIRDADRLGTALNDLLQKVFDVHKTAYAAIDKRRGSRVADYKFLFLLGSLILVGSKVVEWRGAQLRIRQHTYPHATS